MVETYSTAKLRFEPNGAYARRFLRLTSIQQLSIVRAEVACEEVWRACYRALALSSESAKRFRTMYTLAQARVISLRRSLVWGLPSPART